MRSLGCQPQALIMMIISSAFVLLAIGATPCVQAFVSLHSSRTHSTASSQRFVAKDAVKDQPALFLDGTRASVSKYYGQELTKSEDLKTNACCTAGAPPSYIQEAIQNIHPEVVARYYGCGLCLPQYPLEDANILDLGSGSGRDVYIASQLVGKTGKVSPRTLAVLSCTSMARKLADSVFIAPHNRLLVWT